jgi:transposase InsO family protein
MRVTRLRNLSLLVQGILSSGSGSLSAIVRQWSIGSRRHIHRLKHLHRFLKNDGVQVEPVLRTLAAIVWPHRPGGQRTKLVAVAIDWMQVRQFPVLWAAIPRKKRALPLAFGAYHPARLRHSQNKLERGLCTWVASLLPRHVRPLILADQGFGRAEFIRWLKRNGFAFVVRLRAGTLVRYRGQWMPLGSFDTIEGAPLLLPAVAYRGTHPVVVNIVVSRKGNRVWYLGTIFDDAQQTVAWYKKRFWIEEMFRDLKSRLEVEYMTERIHSSLGYLTPAEFEAVFVTNPIPL